MLFFLSLFHYSVTFPPGKTTKSKNCAKEKRNDMYEMMAMMVCGFEN